MRQRNNYFNNLLVSFGSGVALLIAFQTYSLEFITNAFHFLIWLIWLCNFIVFILILKMIFPSLKISSIMDGVWAGIVISIWAPIVKQPFFTNLPGALASSVVYLVFGGIVLFLGYVFRIKD
ncbi:MAG: hypothetical protein ACOCQX_00810 [Candidatus Nanoarchaeia archaeon]